MVRYALRSKICTCISLLFLICHCDKTMNFVRIFYENLPHGEVTFSSRALTSEEVRLLYMHTDKGTTLLSRNSNLSQPNDTWFYRRQRKKNWQIIDRPTLKLVTFSSKYKEKRFLWTQHFERRCVSNKRPTINNRISVSEIGWVTTNCCCMSDLLKYIRNICK